jgi:branched-chain amino acid transport system permease protein
MVTDLHVSPWLGVICGALVAMLFGVLVGVLTLRLSGIYAAVITWFLALSLMAVTTALPALTRGALGLMVPPLFDTFDTGPYLYTLLPIVLVIYLTVTTVAHSRVGLAFRGIGQNIAAARASGVNPTLFRVANFTMSCGFAGLLGAFYGHFIGILTPSFMDTSHTMDVLALAYVGGRGSLWGGIVAALIFIPAFQSIEQLMAGRLVIYGVVLVAVMVFWPGGLAGTLQVLAKKMARPVTQKTPAEVESGGTQGD